MACGAYAGTALSPWLTSQRPSIPPSAATFARGNASSQIITQIPFVTRAQVRGLVRHRHQPMGESRTSPESRRGALQFLQVFTPRFPLQFTRPFPLQFTRRFRFLFTPPSSRRSSDHIQLRSQGLALRHLLLPLAGINLRFRRRVAPSICKITTLFWYCCPPCL